MDQSKEGVAEQLANAHLAVESGITRIVRLRGGEALECDPKEPLKLLEVNEDTFAAGVRPVFFPPSAGRGVPYPTVIVEVTPEEFGRIETGELALPNGWAMAEVLVPAAPAKVARR